MKSNKQPSEAYKSEKIIYEARLKKEKRNLGFISLFRLATIIIAIYFIVLGVKFGINLMFLASGFMVVLFFALVSYHKNKSDFKKLLQQLVRLNETELKCLNNDFSNLEKGDEFKDSSHAWSFDLDLFGDGSLFQYINRTATHRGGKTLADYITTPCTEEQKIKSRQNSIKELSNKLKLRQLFTSHAQLMEVKEGEYEEVIKWSKGKVYIQDYPALKIVAWTMTAISSIIIIAGIFNPDLFKLLIPVLVINWGVMSPFINRTNKYQEQVSKKHNFLKTYSILLDIISNEEFKNPELKEISKKCENASKAISKLSSLLSFLDQRLNVLVGLVLNSLFLYDFHILFQLGAWTKKYGKDLESWLEASGEMDALFSLAGYSFNHPDYITPIIEKDFKGFEAESLAHPMIPSGKRVANSIMVGQEKVLLITGANMAGKSTFLRALGVNLALSYAGCPVCAKSFKTGTYKLISSMRTADSLKNEESYFLAEIKRLKIIVDRMEDGEQLFLLLDEVLKGTNTTDKQKGSRGLIEKSLGHNILCFIATHDLALGKLEEKYKGEVVNYCFESYIKGLELTFDYTIRPGLAKNMNASFLMKQMGIMN